MNHFTKEWLDSIPKSINDNGCWIPSSNRPNSEGYVQVQIQNIQCYLHRVSMCIYKELDYYSGIVTRHNQGCSKACFNPEHLVPGTERDNQIDAVKHKTNFNIMKTHCGVCRGAYTIKIQKTGLRAGVIRRICHYCTNKASKKWRQKQ